MLRYVENRCWKLLLMREFLWKSHNENVCQRYKKHESTQIPISGFSRANL